MGFFNFAPLEKSKSRISSGYLNHVASLGCDACPLALQNGLCNKSMPAFGASRPEIYLLGPAPTRRDDQKGKPFSDSVSRIVDKYLPEGVKVRWNNCVRTVALDGHKPTEIEIEACRPSVIKDIEDTQPKVIVGFGSIPLAWVCKDSRIDLWSGKWIPVRVGKHVCWYLATYDLGFLASQEREFARRGDYKSEFEFAFSRHISAAVALINVPPKKPHTKDRALQSITIYTGERSDDCDKVLDFLNDVTNVENRMIGLDFETTGLRPYAPGARILTIGLSDDLKSVAFALDHKQSRFTQQQRRELQKAFKLFLRRAVSPITVHNLAFEFEWIAVLMGVKYLRADPSWHCSMVQAYLLDERNRSALSLDFLCRQYFGFSLKALSNVNRKALDDESLDRVLTYNALDAKYHRILSRLQLKRLQDEGLSKVYRHHMRRVPTMVLTQVKGMPVDQEVVSQFDQLYSRKIDRLKKKIQDDPKVRKCVSLSRNGTQLFNPLSNQDIKFFITNVLKRDVVSVDEKALASINSPVLQKVLRLRKLTKLHSTYVLSVKTGSPFVWPDGMLHPILSTTNTRTWRTSSEEPNEQNWPKRNDKQVRSQIRPRANQRVVSFDYGQIQARNVAMESKDAALVKAFWDRYDIHADWAERIVRAYPRWIDGGVKALKDKETLSKYRNQAKNRMVFPAFFGARFKKIAKELGIPEAIAQDLLEQFWSEFPDIHRWQTDLQVSYRKTGYVTGLSGFRRRAPITPNELINAPIQADEAIIVCDAMNRLSEEDCDQLQASMEIHDDLTFIWDADKIDENAERVVDVMLNVPFKWARNVPIVVEMSVGRDWASCEDVGKFSSDTWKGGIPDWRKVDAV